MNTAPQLERQRVARIVRGEEGPELPFVYILTDRKGQPIIDSIQLPPRGWVERLQSRVPR